MDTTMDASMDASMDTTMDTTMDHLEPVMQTPIERRHFDDDPTLLLDFADQASASMHREVESSA